MPFEIVRNDIANMTVDAIVNTANPKAIVGFGVDKSVHDKAGPKLILERKKIGPIAVGEAVISPAFRLDAKYVIHTVGPIWMDGNNNEEINLANCYRNSLRIAKENGCTSIAFPLISTGTYGFPKSLALQVAIREISSFILDNNMHIYLVVFEKESYELSEKLFKSISSYIDDNYIEEKKLESIKDGKYNRRGHRLIDFNCVESKESCDSSEENFDKELTFKNYLDSQNLEYNYKPGLKDDLNVLLNNLE